MKCIECGHELKDGAIFCIRCGAMQVSMDGKPIERGENWPIVEQAGTSGFRSSTDGALHSAQSKNPRGFQPTPQRNGGRIAIIIIVIIALIAAIAFGVSQCMGNAVSGGDTSSEASTTTSTTTSDSTTSSTATSSTAASTSSASASTSASATSASASSAASGAAAQSATQTQQPAQPAQPAQQEAPAPAPEPVYNDYYVLPDSSSYYYSYGELSGMSTWDLYIARNEIYARHGRMFNRSDLQDYFNGQAWYEPVYTAAQFDSMGGMLSDVELQNAKLMKQVEADKGSPYL